MTNAHTIDRIEAAAVMYGRGSKQHLAAIKRFGTTAPRSQRVTR